MATQRPGNGDQPRTTEHVEGFLPQSHQNGIEVNYELPRSQWSRQERILSADIVVRGLFPGLWERSSPTGGQPTNPRTRPTTGHPACPISSSPKHHRPKIHSINPLELLTVTNRRTEVIGVLANEPAITGPDRPSCSSRTTDGRRSAPATRC